MDRPLIGVSSSYLPDRRLWGVRLAVETDEPVDLDPFDIVDHHYVRAILDNGGTPLILPLLNPGDTSACSQLVSMLDGLLLSGGGGIVSNVLRDELELPTLREQSPRRYDSDVAYLRLALDRGLPVLGICRGMQTINEALGGTVSRRRHDGHHQRDLPGHLPSHTVELWPDGMLAQLVGTTELQVNSFHAQAVTRPAPGLRAVAWAHDGVIEAIENKPEALPSRFMLGLQFHPERMLGNPQRESIMGAFIRAAG